jgi:hypothetical protein
MSLLKHGGEYVLGDERWEVGDESWEIGDRRWEVGGVTVGNAVW